MSSDPGFSSLRTKLQSGHKCDQNKCLLFQKVNAFVPNIPHCVTDNLDLCPVTGHTPLSVNTRAYYMLKHTHTKNCTIWTIMTNVCQICLLMCRLLPCFFTPMTCNNLAFSAACVCVRETGTICVYNSSSIPFFWGGAVFACDCSLRALAQSLVTFTSLCFSSQLLRKVNSAVCTAVWKDL